MFKQIIAILLLSVAIVLGMTYAQQAVQLLINTHDWIAQMLSSVFSQGQAGNLARDLIALISVPVLAGLIPSLIYWMVKRHWFPYFMEIVWVVWALQVGALVILYRTISV